MSGCIFKLAQLLLFYVPLHILMHEPFIEKKKKMDIQLKNISMHGGMLFSVSD